MSTIPSIFLFDTINVVALDAKSERRPNPNV